jgi:hypothetical protein
MIVNRLVAGLLFLLLSILTAAAQANCRGFISTNCCCSNACCWEISAAEVEPMPGDRWLIRSTGQVLRRTGFSPNGKYYRCACDRDQATGSWIRHQGATTRCIFPPPHLF